MIMVLIACNCFWVVENPRQSLLVRYFRFEQLCNWISYVARLHGCTISHNITNMENHFPEKRFRTYSQVYRGDFWMQLLGGECPKRTSIWSNSSKLANCLNLGQLLKHVREGKTLQTTRHSSAPLLCTMHMAYYLDIFSKLLSDLCYKGSPQNRWPTDYRVPKTAHLRSISRW